MSTPDALNQSLSFFRGLVDMLYGSWLDDAYPQSFWVAGNIVAPHAVSRQLANDEAGKH